MANLLTTLRVASIPAILFLLRGNNFFGFLGLVLYILACLTDYLDGYYARKNSGETEFGVMADNIADKIFTLSILLYLSIQKRLSYIFFVLFMIRDIMVSVLRFVAQKQARIILPSRGAKVKTLLEMVVIGVLLFGERLEKARVVEIPKLYAHILMIAPLFLSITTGVRYFVEFVSENGKKELRKAVDRDKSLAA